MWKITVFYTVVAVTSLFMNGALSVPVQVDVNKFLQILQQQLKQEQAQVQPRKPVVEDDGQFGSLKIKDLEKVFDYAIDDDVYRNKDRNALKNPRLSAAELDNLLQSSNILQPVGNDLIGLDNVGIEPSSSESSDESDSPSEYSKVYVVLNSEAVKKSKNKEKIDALLSSLLAAPPPVQRPPSSGKQKKYKKGFSLSDLSNRLSKSRRSRDSGDIDNDSPIEKEIVRPRPRLQLRERSRPRERLRGGGGGGFMRTAIPYLHQHGDIYEKEDNF